MGTQRIASGRASLAVSESGSGPPVVLLHAGVADRRSWAEVGSALAEGYRVVAYDRRGFGDTEYQAEPHDQVDDLRAVLDALEIERATIIGCSRGGQIAFDAAFRLRDRVAALVLAGSAPSGAPAPEPDSIPPAIEALFDAAGAADEAGDIDEANRLEAHLWLDGPEQPEGRVGDPARRLFLDMNGRALSSAPTGEEAAATAGWRQLPDVVVPTLVVVGRADLPLLVERARMMADAIPAAELVVLEGSAHLPMLDAPAELVAALRSFLDRHWPPA